MQVIIIRSIIISSIIAVLFSQNTAAQHLMVKAEKSQGVYALLRQYDLLQYSCNMEAFYRLNNLKSNAELQVGKKYKLPIAIKKFDGKSIRSSLKISDFQKAKEIEEYNLLAFHAGLKKGDFRKDKELWLPYHYEKCYKQGASISFNRSLPKDETKKINLSPESSEIALSSKHKEKAETNKLKEGIDSNKTKFALGIMTTNASEELPSKYEEDKLVANKRVKYLAEGMVKKVSSDAVQVPLFGEENETVSIADNRLSGQVFYIVPGHGGPDPGAMAKKVDGEHTICEDEYAYDVSLRLAKNLMQSGATVYVIVQDDNDGIRDDKFLKCDCDETVIGGENMPVSQKKRLKQGMNKVNHLYKKHKKKGVSKQWMISIHVDSRKEDDRQDVFFYYQSDSEDSKQRAKRIQDVFDTKYKQYRKDEEYSGTVTSRPLYVMRSSMAEAVFVELGNIQNSRDQKRILLAKNRQLLANWLYEGCID